MNSVQRDPDSVLFLEDICRELRVSRTTVEKLRRHRAFPIPEIPSLDKRPRWRLGDVLAFKRHEQSVAPLRAVRTRTQGASR